MSLPSGKTVKVNFATANGTALAGKDYATTSGLLTFTPGQNVAAVRVRILGNPTAKGTEAFRVILSNPQNATLGTSLYTLTIAGETAAPRWPLYQ